jgi:cytochrome c
MLRLDAIAILAAIAATVTPAAANDPTLGQKFAQAACGNCHDVQPQPAASAPQQGPSFRAIAARWNPELLAESLAEGIKVGHGGAKMPEFTLLPEEIDNLIAYLETLRGAPAR